MEESVGEEGGDCRGVSAEGDRACHVDAEAAEEEDELPAARLRGMEVEAGLGRLAKRAGLAVLGGDPAVLEDVAEDRRGIEGEAVRADLRVRSRRVGSPERWGARWLCWKTRLFLSSRSSYQGAAAPRRSHFEEASVSHKSTSTLCSSPQL